MLIGVLLALLSALWFAAAGALQASVARSAALTAPAVTHPGLRWLPILGLLARLMRSRVWLAGLSLNVLGFVFHAAALHQGSIGIVQALLCVQLMFALPLATLRSRARPLPRDWIGGAAVCLGIMTLIVARGSVPQTMERIHLAPVVTIVALAVVAVLIAAAKLMRDSLRTTVIGVAAGVGFSLTATLIYVVTDQLAAGGPSIVFTHWHVYALAVNGGIAAVVAQDAFAGGSFPAALTAMTVADPVAAWLWGAILFDQVPPVTVTAIAAMTASALLITGGVLLLAYSPTIARSYATAA